MTSYCNYSNFYTSGHFIVHYYLRNMFLEFLNSRITLSSLIYSFIHGVFLSFHFIPALCWTTNALTLLSAVAIHSNDFEIIKPFPNNAKKFFNVTLVLSCKYNFETSFYLISHFKKRLSRLMSVEDCLLYCLHSSLSSH